MVGLNFSPDPSTNYSGERLGSANTLMMKFKSQNLLFQARPGRIALHQAPNNSIEHRRTFKMNVWRNHAVEPILSGVKAYFSNQLWEVDVEISDYDDSLLFGGWEPADIELLWLDSSRFLEKLLLEEWIEWLAVRVGVLRKFSVAPIILATWIPERHLDDFTELISGMPNVYLADLAEVAAEAGLPLVDERTKEFLGSPLNPKLHGVLARKLACHWMAGVLSPPVKAVFVDLDNTLVSGSVSEDGVDALVISSAHRTLQETLLTLRKQGIFLGLISRNDVDEVESLFEQRTDFVLGREDFSVFEVSWGQKSDAVERGLSQLRISADAAVFVDDNPGELLEVGTKLPDICLVHGLPEAEITARAIEYLPGLWRWSREDEDTKRISDLQANVHRDTLLGNSRQVGEYFASLGVRLTFHVNPSSRITRLAGLSSKTNQFNLALKRLNESEILGYMKPGGAVVGVSLADRLSDSGLIGLVLLRFVGSSVLVDEVAISCRALGRKIESAIVLGAINSAVAERQVSDFQFSVTEGPRNGPARAWLDSLENYTESRVVKVAANKVEEFEFPEGVKVEVKVEK